MRIVRALVALALLACSPACGSPDAVAADAGDAGDAGVGCLFCSDATDDAPLAIQVKGKIDQICSNIECHGDGVGHMGLTPGGGEFDAMINVTSFENPPMLRVAPGDPAQSYVYLKLACEGGIPDGFACMPLGAPDPKLAQLFHDWIEAGAPTQ